MECMERVVILTALEKRVSAALKEARREAEDRMRELNAAAGVTKVAQPIGSARGEIVLAVKSAHPTAAETPEFMAHMRERGLTEIRETVCPEWKELVEPDGETGVRWKIDGEITPGEAIPSAIWVPEAAGPMRVSARGDVMREAARLGLLAAEVPELEGGAE